MPLDGASNPTGVHVEVNVTSTARSTDFDASPRGLAAVTVSTSAESGDRQDARYADAILRKLYEQRASLLDLDDSGKLTAVGQLELEEVEREIDHWERVERDTKQSGDRLEALREISGQLMAIQAKLNQSA